MSTPWLHIVGIGEDGLDGLVPATRAVVEAADVILGGDRHHTLSEGITAERLAWPTPFATSGTDQCSIGRTRRSPHKVGDFARTRRVPFKGEV